MDTRWQFRVHSERVHAETKSGRDSSYRSADGVAISTWTRGTRVEKGGTRKRGKNENGKACEFTSSRRPRDNISVGARRRRDGKIDDRCWTNLRNMRHYLFARFGQVINLKSN